MSDAETRERFAEWLKANPEHECEQGDCVHGPSYYLLVSPSKDGDPDGYTVASGTHNITPETVLMAFIDAFDQSIQDSKPEDMPASIAWTYGRELLKKLAEEVEPPGDVNANIGSFIQQMMDEMKAEESDE